MKTRVIAKMKCHFRSVGETGASRGESESIGIYLSPFHATSKRPSPASMRTRINKQDNELNKPSGVCVCLCCGHALRLTHVLLFHLWIGGSDWLDSAILPYAGTARPMHGNAGLYLSVSHSFLTSHNDWWTHTLLITQSSNQLNIHTW